MDRAGTFFTHKLCLEDMFKNDGYTVIKKSPLSTEVAGTEVSLYVISWWYPLCHTMRSLYYNFIIIRLESLILTITWNKITTQLLVTFRK